MGTVDIPKDLVLHWQTCHPLAFHDEHVPCLIPNDYSHQLPALAPASSRHARHVFEMLHLLCTHKRLHQPPFFSEVIDQAVSV